MIFLELCVIVFLQTAWADYIPEPRGVCVDPRGCSLSSEGSSSSGGGSPPNIAWGGMTKRAGGMISECGNKPLCLLLRTAVLLPIGLAFDAPVYAAKGLVLGAYYGGRGLAKGTKAVGKGISSPVRAARARTRRIAYTPVAGCLDSPVSKDSFQAYRDWEICKESILKRQRAYTKRNPTNEENEEWCRARIPLAAGPNRAAWEKRCNPDAPAPAVENAVVLEAPKSAAFDLEKAPTLESAGIPGKAASCALGELSEEVEDFGEQGKDFVKSLSADAAAIAAELAGSPVSSKKDAVDVRTAGVSSMISKGGREYQALAQMGVQRFAEDGRVHLDLMWSFSAPDVKEKSGQILLFVGADGSLRSPASRRIKRCLDP